MKLHSQRMKVNFQEGLKFLLRKQSKWMVLLNDCINNFINCLLWAYTHWFFCIIVLVVTSSISTSARCSDWPLEPFLPTPASTWRTGWKQSYQTFLPVKILLIRKEKTGIVRSTLHHGFSTRSKTNTRVLCASIAISWALQVPFCGIIAGPGSSWVCAGECRMKWVDGTAWNDLCGTPGSHSAFIIALFFCQLEWKDLSVVLFFFFSYVKTHSPRLGSSFQICY